MSWRRRWLLAVPAALALLAGLVALALGPGRIADSVRLLRSTTQALDDPGSIAVDRERLRYSIRGLERIADLYRSPARAEAALVLVPGATPLGLDDPALMAFAGALARSGFLVLVPRLAGDDPVRVSAADAEPIADALAYLTAQSGVEHAGLAAISYAAGPAFLAALKEEARMRIAFLFVIGGYYDITAAVTYLTTGHYRDSPNHPWREGPVDDRAKWRFLLANADRIGASDTALLRRIARLKLRDPDSEIDHLSAMLSEDGKAAWRLLVNSEPERTPALIAGLPAGLRRSLEALDLARRDLSTLEFPVLLVHGRDDPMIPPAESRALERALPSETTELIMPDSLFHVRFRALGAADAFGLFRLAYRLMTLRDRAPAPTRRPGPSSGAF